MKTLLLTISVILLVCSIGLGEKGVIAGGTAYVDEMESDEVAESRVGLDMDPAGLLETVTILDDPILITPGTWVQR